MRAARSCATGTYYSVGGGFVVSDEPAGGTEKRIVPDLTRLPFPFRSGDELLELCEREKTSIAGIMRRNERAWRSDAEIDAGLLHIWDVMQACVQRGCDDAGRAARRLQGEAARAGAVSRSSRRRKWQRRAIH